MADDTAGPAAAGRPEGAAGPVGRAGSTQDFAGQGLGRPASGPGSVATLTRRAAALLVDWLLAVLVGQTLLGPLESFAPLVVFAVVQVLLVGTLGYSVGHRATGLVVERAGGGPAGPVAALLRTFLILLVIPAVVVDEDGRGLHDRAAGTVVVRR